jgi:integrase
LADGGGLHALIHTSGSVLWRYNYVYAGKAKTLALGQYPAISLKEARQLHQEAKRSLKRGIDPLEARQAVRADLEAARAARKTFKDAAAGWRELINKKPRAEKTRDRDERMIGYLTRAFGNKPMDEVQAKDLIDLLETFEDNESYETRARLQAAALNIGGYAQGKAWIKHNPFLGIAYGKAFTSPTNQPRPAITEAEPFGQLLRDVAAYSGRQGNLVRKALDLLALTFVRPGTVTQAEWDEFDPDGALWTIPFKKLKQRKFRESIKELRGKPHYVSLSRQAVALLRDLKSRLVMVVTCFPVVRVGRYPRMHWRSRSTASAIRARIAHMASGRAPLPCCMLSGSRSIAQSCRASPSRRLTSNLSMSTHRWPRSTTATNACPSEPR